MKFKSFIIFFFLSLSVFSQTDELVDLVNNTSNDSIKQFKPLKELLIQSVRLEYSGVDALNKYTDIAILFYSKDILEFSQDFFELALNEADKLQDFDKKAELLSNIGVVNEIRGDYVVALSNYQQSLNTFREAGNLRSQSVVYNNIAIVHQELGNVDQAYQNLSRSYEIKKELNDSSLIASALNNYGVFYEECVYNLDSALVYYSKAEDFYRKIGDKINEGICASNVAQVLHSLGDVEDSRTKFVEAIVIFRSMDNRLWLSKVLMYLASLEMDSEKYEVAVELLEESKSLLDSEQHTRTLMEISEILSEAYLESSHFEKSAYEYRHYEYLKDSLINIDKQNEISKLEIKFQTAEKQYEIDTLKIEKEIQEQRITRIIWIVIAIVLILILIIAFLYMRVKQRKLEMQNKNMHLKQQLLQNQMNPHFLFNVLTSIQSYITRSDTDKASYYLAKFSKLTRMVLQSSAEETILLEDELILLTNYLHLEKLMLNDSFDFEISVEDGLESDSIEIPPMMVQPFLENAIVHGVSKVDNGLIKLVVLQKDEMIEFIVTDNGPGIKENENKSSDHKSMATSILQERKEILKQKWQKPVKIQRNETDTGTEVVVGLPII